MYLLFNFLGFTDFRIFELLDIMKRMKKTPEKALTKKDLDHSINHAITHAFDGFARIMKKSFDEVHEKMDAGFKAADERFEDLEKSNYEIKTTLEDTRDRVTRIEKIVEPLIPTVDTMKKNWKDHEIRITKLEKKAH